jgi:hypothetical protein
MARPPRQRPLSPAAFYRSGAAHQEHALRYPCPKPPVRFGIAQEGDQLLQFKLRFVDTGNVLERHFGVSLNIDFGA